MKIGDKLSLLAIAGNALLGVFLYKKTKEVDLYTKNLDRDIKRLEVHITDINESLRKASVELESSNKEILGSLESLYGTTKRKNNCYRKFNK